MKSRGGWLGACLTTYTRDGLVTPADHRMCPAILGNQNLLPFPFMPGCNWAGRTGLSSFLLQQ